MKLIVKAESCRTFAVETSLGVDTVSVLTYIGYYWAFINVCIHQKAMSSVCL